MVVKNYDLKHVTKVIGTAPTSLALGYVGAGMKRYITFLAVENRFGGDNKLWLASVATDTYASTPTRASARAKWRMLLANGEHREIPNVGPTPVDRPLFSIAAGAYLNALTDQGDAVVHVQYYEE